MTVIVSASVPCLAISLSSRCSNLIIVKKNEVISFKLVDNTRTDSLQKAIPSWWGKSNLKCQIQEQNLIREPHQHIRSQIRSDRSLSRVRLFATP